MFLDFSTLLVKNFLSAHYSHIHSFSHNYSLPTGKEKKRNLVIEKLKFGSFNTINQLESQHVNSKRRQKEDPPIPLPRYVNMNYKLEQNMAFQGMHDKSRVHEKAQII